MRVGHCQVLNEVGPLLVGLFFLQNWDGEPGQEKLRKYLRDLLRVSWKMMATSFKSQVNISETRQCVDH